MKLFFIISAVSGWLLGVLGFEGVGIGRYSAKAALVYKIILTVVFVVLGCAMGGLYGEIKHLL